MMNSWSMTATRLRLALEIRKPLGGAASLDVGALLEKKSAVVFGTYAADFNAIEYGQRLRHYAPKLKERGVESLHLILNADEAAVGSWRGLRINSDYVQDLVEDDAARIASILFSEHGHLYVCGDGQAMAGDVHAALRRIAMRKLHLGEAEAEARLASLANEGRYCREVWN